jgi:hypothetical protein
MLSVGRKVGANLNAPVSVRAMLVDGDNVPKRSAINTSDTQKTQLFLAITQIAARGELGDYREYPFVIDRYRQLALAQGYVGDSVVNSIVDILAGAFGFVLARILPVWSTVVLMVGMELFVGFMIHDNLTLNIIQLIHPNGSNSHWQAGQ